MFEVSDEPGANVSAVAIVLMSTLFVNAQDVKVQLRQALTLHASFDQSADADFAKGDGRLLQRVKGPFQHFPGNLAGTAAAGGDDDLDG